MWKIGSMMSIVTSQLWQSNPSLHVPQNLAQNMFFCILLNLTTFEVKISKIL